jgi:hypothetical protein
MSRSVIEKKGYIMYFVSQVYNTTITIFAVQSKVAVMRVIKRS